MAFSNFTPSPRPQNFGAAAQAPQMGENNSGQGPNTPVPDIVARKFNWGAFLLTFIWALGHRAYLLALLMFLANLIYFIPLFGGIICLGLCIFFGIKGNEWAWQNKKFQSVEYFHNYEKKWAIAGVIVSISLFIISIFVTFLLTIPALNTLNKEHADIHHKYSLQRHIITIETTAMMKEATEQRCDFSSAGLAMCFEEDIKGERIGNSITASSDGTILTFVGNGVCKQEGDCKVTIQTGEGKTQETSELPLYVNDDGYIYIKKEDHDKILNTDK